MKKPWLGLILVAFCLPLFIGLGGPDLETDEAIYSFAVDRMLEIGDWLEPKLSPSETDVFLEKPPLKFWIVAAPIKAGLLPHNEFGLRFWDAVAGSLAFCYVFAIGSLLAGPVCGAVAVLLLFIHWPLVFAHGLRTNNMEASLVLSYCAGVYHFLRWSALDDLKRRRRHLTWLAVFFVLGFMTKFVAALFLPLILGLATLAGRSARGRLAEDSRAWLQAAGLAALLCAPWFLYAQIRFGAQFWEIILGEHVLRRMTSFVDPTHVQPWYFYVAQIWEQFELERMQWLFVVGLLLLLVQTIRRRWFAGAVVLLWGTLPLLIISSGSSKLYHYAYPYLPPLALAAGYLVALVTALAPAPLRRVLEWVEDTTARFWPQLETRMATPGARRIVSALVVSAAAIAIVSLAIGGLRIELGGTMLFKSSGATRPAALIVLLAVLSRTSARVTSLVVAIVVFGAMPLNAYRGQLERLSISEHPMRTAAECLQRVQGASHTDAGILIDIPEGIWHPLYYYFRRVQPVTLASSPQDPAVEKALDDPSAPRPVLISDRTWAEFSARRNAATSGTLAQSPPMVTFLNTVLILPGPYAVCSSEAAAFSGR